MKKNILLLVTLCLLAGSAVILWHKMQVLAQEEASYVTGELLVRFKPGVNAAEAALIHRQLRGTVKEVIPQLQVHVVSVDTDVEKAVAAYTKNPRVVYAEPNYIVQALDTPDDVHFSRQWGLHNPSDTDIDAPEAWDISKSSETVVIAILDSGIDTDHEDLKAKVIFNEDYSGSGSYDDFYGHGTHVAGIAAAMTNNSTTGVAGTGYNAMLMNMKVLNNDGSGSHASIANGIMSAIRNNAQIINLSLGGMRTSSTLENAVNQAWNSGLLIVAAAGNSDNPSKTYPAYYPNVIAVAATDANNDKAPFSSYGDWVDVAAPGVNIYSTFPNHTYKIAKSLNYDYGSGTSMATPFVAGVAALVWTTDLGGNNLAVRNQIEQTAEPITGTGRYWIWGKINACNAVGGTCAPTNPPIMTPTPTPTGSASITPTPQPDACFSYCFKSVCDGVCHRAKDKPGCPDCFKQNQKQLFRHPD
jgi:thermitase